VVEKRVKIAIDLILNSAIEEWQKQGGAETHLEAPSVLHVHTSVPPYSTVPAYAYEGR
jgi:hypothetical protein